MDIRLRQYVATDLAEVQTLLRLRARADGRAPLSEHKQMRVGTAAVLEVVARSAGDELVGFGIAAHHDAGTGHWAIEIVVAPGVTFAATFGAVAAALRSRIEPSEAVTVWAWRPEELAVAEGSGWRLVRRLHEMTVALPVDGERRLPDGVTLRTFRPGSDEAAWLAANAAAFAEHPENGSVDRANLEARLAQPWFDPKGFLMAWDGADLIGYCWTKLHERSVGEIYIIGVVPGAQGRGLGRGLLLAGLDDLAHRQGATTGMLYVADSDVRALHLYRQVGFDVAFSLSEFAVPPARGVLTD